MKKEYVKPMLNASMNGTLEGVYACNDPWNCSNKNHHHHHEDPKPQPPQDCYCWGFGWFW
jgi:hypothetical protein